MSYNRASTLTPELWPLSERDGGPAIPPPPPWAVAPPSVDHGTKSPRVRQRQTIRSTEARFSDRPMPLGTRLFGLAGTGLVCLLLIGAALFKWQTNHRPQATATLSVFDVAPPEAPPAPDSEIPPGPEQIQKDEQPQVETPAIPLPLVQIPNVSPASIAVVEPVKDPGPPIEQTTAPESRPQPPGAKSSDAKPTWEGQVLAALNQAKRYPREAKRNRQQGMPWISFTMDRDGRVRGVRLERSSGFDVLDREALALPMRASPLPKPPDSVTGDRIVLTVPVEFFIT